MEEKISSNKKNIIIMVSLILMLIIGIIARHNYIKSEIKETIKFYKERMHNDSI